MAGGCHSDITILTKKVSLPSLVLPIVASELEQLGRDAEAF